MPTATTENTTKSPSAHDGRQDALDAAHRALLDGESTGGEAIAGTVHALTELTRALLPGIVMQPARALDVFFQFLQQSLTLQRRMLHELLGSVQAVMADAAADQSYYGPSMNGHGADRGEGRTGTRTAAA